MDGNDIANHGYTFEFPQSTTNPINPDYYDKQSEYQPRFVAKRWGLDPYLFNALKYICRAGKKESDKEVQDLQKACQYIQFRIEELQGK